MKLRLVTLVAAAALSSLALAPAMAANYTTTTPAAAAPAAGSMMAKPTVHRTAKATPDPKRFNSVASAQASCLTDTIVWSNTKSKIFHLSGTATFGKGSNGAYMCETAAKAEGFVPTKKPEKLVSSAK